MSALSHQFVKDPRDVVKAGDIVKVKVITVDVGRSRIGLSMRLDDPVGLKRPPAKKRRGMPSGSARQEAGAAKPGVAGYRRERGRDGVTGALLLQAQKKQNRS